MTSGALEHYWKQERKFLASIYNYARKSYLLFSSQSRLSLSVPVFKILLNLYIGTLGQQN